MDCKIRHIIFHTLPRYFINCQGIVQNAGIIHITGKYIIIYRIYYLFSRNSIYYLLKEAMSK